MRRLMLMAVTVVMALSLSAGPAAAEDPWEKLFGCEGIAPISCPGPDPW